MSKGVSRFNVSVIPAGDEKLVVKSFEITSAGDFPVDNIAAKTMPRQITIRIVMRAEWGSFLIILIHHHRPDFGEVFRLRFSQHAPIHHIDSIAERLEFFNIEAHDQSTGPQSA